MYRIKQLTESSLENRTEETRSNESHLKCLITNKITVIEMHKSS
jgi:hypothetical protein